MDLRQKMESSGEQGSPLISYASLLYIVKREGLIERNIYLIKFTNDPSLLNVLYFVWCVTIQNSLRLYQNKI